MPVTEVDLNNAAERSEVKGIELTQLALAVRQQVADALAESENMLVEHRLLAARAEAAGSVVPGGYMTGLVVEGDSISEQWPALFATATGLPTINVALQGTTLQDMRRDYGISGGPGPVYTAGGYNVLLLNASTNDFMLNDDTLPRVLGFLNEFIAKAKATGYELYLSSQTVKVVGALNGLWDQSRENRRIAFNADVKANWQSYGADGFVDLEQSFTTADLEDGVHPNATGRAKMAAYVRNYFISKGMLAPVTAPSGEVFALLHLNEGADATRPTTVVNSISGGPEFNNWGQNKAAGGRFLTDSSFPFGKGLDAQGTDGLQIAISSTAPVPLTSTFTLEGFFSKLDGYRDVFQISSNGDDSGAFRVRMMALASSLYIYIRVGAVDIEFETDPIAPAAVGGMSSGFHIALVRRADNFMDIFSNKNRVGVTPVAVPGDLTGYVDLFGSFNRVNNEANGLFQAKIGELRASRAVLYTGATYTVPTARFSS